MTIEVQQGDEDIRIGIKRKETARLWAPFLHEDKVTPVILSGATAKLELRRNHSAITADLSLSVGAGLTIRGEQGTIEILITSAQSAALDGVYVFDLWVQFANGDRFPLCGGEMSFSKGVTDL